MIFLLDTNAISDLMRRHPGVHKRLASISADDRIAVSTIVRGEILYGVERLPAGKRQTELRTEANDVLRAISSQAMPEGAAGLYATIKASCERRGIRLDENDLWIAATALALDATLVTRDADFAGIPDIRVEDWTVIR